MQRGKARAMIRSGPGVFRAIGRGRWSLPTLATLMLVGGLAGCRARPSPPAPATPVAPPSAPAVPSGPAVSNGSGPPILPDSQRTPGATLAVTTEDICVPGYTQKVRDVPSAVKQQVYAEYGITHHQPGEYEVDHLISLELGGSNSIKNLWPESYETEPWNAHVKDQIENELHRLVCSGQLDLKTAQQAIATDWIAAYKQYFHTEVPLTGSARRRRLPAERRRSTGEATGAAAPPESAPNQPAGEQVWVNTRSGKYFLPGSRYYGQTKEGEYMPAAEARRQGFTPARGE